MATHQDIAKLAVSEISAIGGINKIILYGSVSRGTEKENSDIDLAIIFDQHLRMFPITFFEGLPEKTMETIQKIVAKLEEKYHIPIEINPLWEDRFNAGIYLEGNKYPYKDKLNDVGKIVYQSD